MNRSLSLIFFIMLSGLFSSAQITLGTKDHVIELSGQLSTFYNYRFQEVGNSTLDHNRFDLRDAIVR